VECASIADWDAAPANPKRPLNGRPYSAKAVDAALLSTTLLQGIRLMRTRNLPHSLAALRYVAERASQRAEKTGQGAAEYTAALRGAPVAPEKYEPNARKVKAKKAANFAGGALWQAMLCAVPGVSNAAAEAVAKTFSASDLCQNFAESPASAATELAAVEIETAGGKRRRLGPSVSGKIKQVTGLFSRVQPIPFRGPFFVSPWGQPPGRAKRLPIGVYVFARRPSSLSWAVINLLGGHLRI